MENADREECLYRGHRICVETEELEAGAWSWRYLVDGKTIVSRPGNETAPDAATALKWGLASAMAEVEAGSGQARGERDATDDPAAVPPPAWPLMG
jgi:hypothetical protein